MTAVYFKQYLSSACMWACILFLTLWDVALQLFFGLLSLVLLGVKFKSDKRDQYLQHGGWIVKVGLWVGFNIIAFLAPVGLVNAYCEPFLHLACRRSDLKLSLLFTALA